MATPGGGDQRRPRIRIPKFWNRRRVGKYDSGHLWRRRHGASGTMTSRRFRNFAHFGNYGQPTFAINDYCLRTIDTAHNIGMSTGGSGSASTQGGSCGGMGTVYIAMTRMDTIKRSEAKEEDLRQYLRQQGDPGVLRQFWNHTPIRDTQAAQVWRKSVSPPHFDAFCAANATVFITLETLNGGVQGRCQIVVWFHSRHKWPEMAVSGQDRWPPHKVHWRQCMWSEPRASCWEFGGGAGLSRKTDVYEQRIFIRRPGQLSATQLHCWCKTRFQVSYAIDFQTFSNVSFS